MVEMMKDLQQKVCLLKEGRTQGVRDNIPLVAKEERPQPDGGFAMGKGTNPQYLTLVNVNALLKQERERHRDPQVIL